jgi:hypothetical protein
MNSATDSYSTVLVLPTWDDQPAFSAKDACLLRRSTCTESNADNVRNVSHSGLSRGGSKWLDSATSRLPKMSALAPANQADRT